MSNEEVILEEQLREEIVEEEIRELQEEMQQEIQEEQAAEAQQERTGERLPEIENEIQAKTQKLSLLHEGYSATLTQVVDSHQGEIRPLIEKRNLIQEQMDFVRMQIDWLSKKAEEQEKVETIKDFDEETAMGPHAVDALTAARIEMNEAYDAFDSKCTPEALKKIGDCERPSQVVLETLQMVCHIREEEDDSWENAKVLLTSNYFVEFFRRRSEFLLKTRDVLSPELMAEIDDYCSDPRHSVDSLYEICEPVGVFGEWIRATRSMYRLRYYSAPLLLKNKTKKNTRAVKEALHELTFQHDQVLAIEGPGADEGPALIEDRPAEGAAPPSERSASRPANSEGQLVVRDNKGGELAPYQPSYKTQKSIQELEQLLEELEARKNQTQAEVDEVERVICEEVRQVQSQYDADMVAAEEELEDQVKDYVEELAASNRHSRIE